MEEYLYFRFFKIMILKNILKNVKRVNSIIKRKDEEPLVEDMQLEKRKGDPLPLPAGSAATLLVPFLHKII